LAKRKERRGRPRITTPAAHCAAYDKNFKWRGFSQRLLEDAKRYSLTQLLEKYGARTGWTTPQAVSRALAAMNGGKQKPRVRGKVKMRRPDVPVSLVRKLAKVFSSISAIAKKCRTWDDTIKDRARQGGFALPNGIASLRCSIPPERLSHFARQGECAAVIARRFGYWAGTVTQHAKRHGIRLPNGNDARSTRALRRRQKVLRFHKRGIPARRITLLLGMSKRTIERDLQLSRHTLRKQSLAS